MLLRKIHAALEAGMPEEALVSIADFLQSRIHHAFTCAADDLCSMGYLPTQTRIDVSHAIGEVLDLFRDKMAELGIDQMGLQPDVASDLVMKYAQVADVIGGQVDRITVVVVDGEQVRGEIDIDFTMGGHHYRYGYIPEDEIWIDDGLARPMDIIATLVHELIERTLIKHLNYYYDAAHGVANHGEQAVRSDWTEHETPEGANGFHHNAEGEDDNFWVELTEVVTPLGTGKIRFTIHRPGSPAEVHEYDATDEEVLDVSSSFRVTHNRISRVKIYNKFRTGRGHRRISQQLPGTYGPLAEEELPGTGRIDIGKKGEDEEDENEKESGKSYDILRTIVEATAVKPKTGIWFYYNYQLYTKFGDPNTLPSHVEWLDSEGIKVVGVEFDRIPRGSVYFLGAYTTDERPMVDLVATCPGGAIPNNLYEKILDAFKIRGAQVTEQDYQEAYGRVACRVTMKQALQSVAPVGRVAWVDLREGDIIGAESTAYEILNTPKLGRDRVRVKDSRTGLIFTIGRRGMEEKIEAGQWRHDINNRQAQSTESDPYGPAGGTRQPEPNRFLSEDIPQEVLSGERRDEQHNVEVWGYDPANFVSDDGPLLRPGA